MAAVRVRIGSIAVPAGRRVDADDLGRRVEQELATLLALDPVAGLDADRTVQVAGGPVRTASAVSAASLAHALALRIHAGLKAEAPRS